LGELLSVDPEAELDELDYALRSYIAFAAYFMGKLNIQTISKLHGTR